MRMIKESRGGRTRIFIARESSSSSSFIKQSFQFLKFPLVMSTEASSIAGSSSTDNGDSLQQTRVLSSKLYFDIPLSKVPLIYSSSYNIAFFGLEKLHPFDSSKWGRICKFLIMDGILDKKCVVEPLEATKDDLLVMELSGDDLVMANFLFDNGQFVMHRVHSESYLSSLKNSLNVSFIIEIPPVALLPNWIVQKNVLYPFRKQVGGTILAAKLAKERGWAINVGGGFHHCCADKGGGFCAYADITLSIHFAFIRLNISRVMIIDLDAHQGNGHEKDFGNDRRVYILDIYNPEIYPFDFEARRNIDQKVEVKSGTATDEYLIKLDEALEIAENKFDAELIVYNAGTDILEGDPLGRLKISPNGITRRDEKVFEFARKKNIPIIMLTSGGYMKTSAKVIADSIANLSRKGLIEITGSKLNV